VKTKSARAWRKPSLARTRKKLEGVLGQLQEAELVRLLDAGELEYSFKHALVQDTAYASMLKGDHKRLHLRVAHVYEKLSTSDGADSLAPLLARHYAAAGDDAKTLEYAARAGDQAARVYANTEAISFYTLALEAASHLDDTPGSVLVALYTKRGRAFELNAQYPEALQNYLEMEAVAAARKDRTLELQSIVLRTTLHATATPLFDPVLARQLSDRALALARELDDRAATAKILWNLLLLCAFTRNFPEAVEYGEQSLEIARALDLREQLAFTLTNLGSAYIGLGQIERARADINEAQGIWRELGNLPLLADNLMMSGTLLYLKGDFDEALSILEQGAEISRRIDNVWGQYSNMGGQIGILIERGEYERALGLTESVLEGIERHDALVYVALSHAMRTWVWASLGAIEQAREEAQRVIARLNAAIPPFFRAWIFGLLTRCFVACGAIEAATETMTQTRSVSTLQTFEPSLGVGTLAEGELALARGEFAHAARVMQDYCELVERYRIVVGLADARYLQAQALRAQGAADEAKEVLVQVRPLADRLQLRPALWRILAALGEIERERGNAAEAAALAAEARAIIAAIAERTPAKYRDSFLNRPAVRAVRD
jgi:tetratricopeptide (TPR) repeat protein